MKKSFFWLITLFILLTTYTPKFSFKQNLKLNIQEIIIVSNPVLDSGEIKKNIDFLYDENLFFLDNKSVEKNLKNIDFIESLKLKKIYPNKIKLTIIEKTPIAILQNKKKRSFISNQGDLIKFKNVIPYNDLPIVFGNKNDFYALYKELENIKFPLKTIKTFYFFESGRWDLITQNEKVIKLPIEGYLTSLKNFIKSQKNDKFNTYKIFDYRIKEQLILN
jgi:cell division protein FtsQ